VPQSRIPKYTEEEAVKWLEQKGKSTCREDRANYFRWCGHCDTYVHVDDFSGANDICDDCDSR
jgi:hypothetical protein